MTLLSPNHNHAADECIAQIPQHHIPTQEEKARASERFDKPVLTAAHMAALHDAYILEMATHPAHDVTIKPASPTSTLAGLKSSCLRQLKIGKVHRKRILVGTLCSKTLCSHTPNGLFIVNVLEDEEGLATPIYLSNALEENCGSHQAQRLYPQGSKVAIKEPYLTRLPDGVVYLSVEKPSDFAFLWVPENHNNGSEGAVGEQEKEVVDFGAGKEVDNSAGNGKAAENEGVDFGAGGKEVEVSQEVDDSVGNDKAEEKEGVDFGAGKEVEASPVVDDCAGNSKAEEKEGVDFGARKEVEASPVVDDCAGNGKAEEKEGVDCGAGNESEAGHQVDDSAGNGEAEFCAEKELEASQEVDDSAGNGKAEEMEVVDFGAGKELEASQEVDGSAGNGKAEEGDGAAVVNGADGAGKETESNQEFDSLADSKGAECKEIEDNAHGADAQGDDADTKDADRGDAEDKEQLDDIPGAKSSDAEDKEQLDGVEGAKGGYGKDEEQLDAHGRDSESKERESSVDNGDGCEAGEEQGGSVADAGAEGVATAPIAGNRELSFDYLTEMQGNGKASGACEEEEGGGSEAGKEGRGEEEADGKGKAEAEEEGNGESEATGEVTDENGEKEEAASGGGEARAGRTRELSMQDLVGMRKEAPKEEMEEVEAASSLRAKGNALFARGQYAGAAEMYKRGARKAKGGGERGEEVMCVSNAAEAWLRVGRNQDALAEAEGALALLQEAGPIDGGEMAEAKALFRRARALMGLHRFEEALAVLQQVLAMAPADRQLREAATKCKDRLLRIVKPGKRQRASALRKKNTLPIPAPAP